MDEVLKPGFLEGVQTWPIDEVRSRRDRATAVETGLSYIRRIVQGRLDIVLAERSSREGGQAGANAQDLLEKLPQLLGDRVHAPGPGRLTPLLGPGDLEPELVERVDQALPPGKLGALADLDDGELSTAAQDLDSIEREVSARRRDLFEVIDRLQGELVRRYRTGEAAVESLLP